MPNTNPKTTPWKISRLKEHPRQRELFPDLPEPELEALAADIEANGLQHAIHVLPDGTILAGHQRVLAAKRLGWKTIEVIIRHDLASDPPAAEAFFIGDNLHRRHLSRLQRVLCIQHLLEIEGKRTEAIKTKIGKQLGLSLRTVNRYLLIAQSPREIQQAFDRGELSLVEACRATTLPSKQPQQLADRIACGDSPRAVLKEFLTRDDRCGDHVGGVFSRFVNALKRDLPLLNNRVHEINPRSLLVTKERLHEARIVLDQMLKRVK